MYYYDEEGHRVFEMYAFEHTFFRGFLAVLTFQIVKQRIQPLVMFDFVDDFPDITVIHPGGKLLPGITASKTPRPNPLRGDQLRLYSDPEVRRTLPWGHLPLPKWKTYFRPRSPPSSP